MSTETAIQLTIFMILLILGAQSVTVFTQAFHLNKYISKLKQLCNEMDSAISAVKAVRKENEKALQDIINIMEKGCENCHD